MSPFVSYAIAKWLKSPIPIATSSHNLVANVLIVVCISMVCCASPALSQDQFENAPNTQKLEIPITPPEKALKMLSVPKGFEATLFAAEPDVHQPIAATIDERGRLWVVECYTYSDRKDNFNMKLNDRVVIFDDVDHDGEFDKRTVFWDQGKKLTGIEVGLGGVWLTAAPQLLFIPDKNRDDKPDGEPVVLLDGFEDNVIRHNIVNGLRWGPDGWLYGRHGIQGLFICRTSRIDRVTKNANQLLHLALSPF